MRRMGFEPMRLSPCELESHSLTNSDIFAVPCGRRTGSLKSILRFGSCCTDPGWTVDRQPPELQDMGFEPMRISPLAPQASPVTTWVILHMQGMGFEPMRISPLGPEPSPVTTWVTLLKPRYAKKGNQFLKIFGVLLCQA